MSDDETFRDTLAKLVEAADEEDLAEVQSLTSKIFSSKTALIPDSLQTIVEKSHCRSLIGLARFEDALEFCASLGQEDRELLVLERTYALYKLGQYASCRDVIYKQRSDILSEDTIRGLAHILAQCHYRLQETQKVIQLYNDLAGAADYDEDSEIVTNALAASISNNSIPIEFTGIQELHDTIMKEISNVNSKLEYPYEMVYNYATHLLQTSTSLSQTKQALGLLSSAEEECRAIFEESMPGDETMMLKDLLPIQTNIALGHLQSGDLNGALRSNLEVILSSKKVLEKDPNFNSGGGMFAAEHNLGVVNQRCGSSSSPYDLLKKMPEMSSGLDTRKNLINPNQIRIMLYNRAVLYHQMGKFAEMKSTLNILRSSLSPNAQVRRQVENGKKKRKNTGSSGSKFYAIPVSNVEKLLWECRIAILENDNLEGVEKAISDATNKRGGVEQYGIDIHEYVIAELSLHKAQKGMKDNDKLDSNDRIALVSTLENLPASIRDRPANVASLCSLYRSLDMNDKVEGTLNASLDSGMAQKSLADFKLRLGMFGEAVVIYESLLSGGSDLSLEETMECNAGLVKALSHIDIEKALNFAETIKLDDNDNEIDGEVLEAMNIPRLSKGSIGGVRASKINSSREIGRNKKGSKNAILKQRAKNRDAYLQKLQKEGNYNPDRPTKPDPERWIPKNQRSYNRRGRRGRQKFLGAQGGGTGFGAEKDAAKLDVYARAAAKAAGKDMTGGIASTAHLSVASSGRRRR